MTRRHLALAACSLLLACACGTRSTPSMVIENPHDGLWQAARDMPFRFVLEQTYGVEDGAEAEMLGDLGSVAVDGVGRVYIVDSSAGELVSFDADGSLRWRVGRKGEGPGELSGVTAMSYDGRSLLYLANQGGRRIDRFDLDGRYVDSHAGEEFETRGMPPLFGLPVPDTLLISKTVVGRHAVSVLIVSVTGDWEVVRTFELADSIEFRYPEMIAGWMPVRLDEGRLVTGSRGAYRFRVFDRNGRIERIMTRADVPMLLPLSSRTERGYAMYLSSETSLIGTVAGYHIVTTWRPARETSPDDFMSAVKAGGPGTETSYSIDYYDADWKLLYAHETLDALELNPPRGLVAVGPDDRLYVRMSNGIQVGRYRMEVVEP